MKSLFKAGDMLRYKPDVLVSVRPPDRRRSIGTVTRDAYEVTASGSRIDVKWPTEPGFPEDTGLNANLFDLMFSR